MHAPGNGDGARFSNFPRFYSIHRTENVLAPHRTACPRIPNLLLTLTLGLHAAHPRAVGHGAVFTATARRGGTTYLAVATAWVATWLAIGGSCFPWLRLSLILPWLSLSLISSPRMTRTARLPFAHTGPGVPAARGFCERQGSELSEQPQLALARAGVHRRSERAHLRRGHHARRKPIAPERGWQWWWPSPRHRPDPQPPAATPKSWRSRGCAAAALSAGCQPGVVASAARRRPHSSRDATCRDGAARHRGATAAAAAA